jgi:hypothetical protein
METSDPISSTLIFFGKDRDSRFQANQKVKRSPIVPLNRQDEFSLKTNDLNDDL